MELFKTILVIIKIVHTYDLVTNPLLPVLVSLKLALDRLKNIVIIPDLDQIELTHKHRRIITNTLLISGTNHTILRPIYQWILRHSIHNMLL